MNGPINVSVASQKTRRKLHRNRLERIKESKWGTSCKSSESNILETQVIFSYSYSELARTLLPVESTIAKIKITHHRVMRDV